MNLDRVVMHVSSTADQGVVGPGDTPSFHAERLKGLGSIQRRGGLAGLPSGHALGITTRF